MKDHENQGFETLGACAYQAVQQHFKKSIKSEIEVLADKNPEPLHQMRVGMRRLRTAIAVFDCAINLPAPASDRRIQKIAHTLGAVRDLDVLALELETRYYPQLPASEQKLIKAALKKLWKQRRTRFSKLEAMLKGKQYQKFQKAFSHWLENPQFYAIAQLPVTDVLPDLLSPLISQLLLHPGWLVRPDAEPKSRSSKSLALESEATLHDLRKQIKRVRYQVEFFLGFYDDAYTTQVNEFKTLQDLLGHLQDQAVLSQFLSKQLKVNLKQTMPTLAVLMQQYHQQLWQTWQPIQQRYLNAEFRSGLRQQVLTPLKVAPVPISDRDRQASRLQPTA